ncbi:chemotaxis response regulator protein-glutamate methylesterase [Maricaulis sp. W15]|uniref:protein-glutamate methylesterase/protein-glutamine glutaminase n=1 Tax=Maricaulis sp. W15 TaxID=1772333 RepID=UPI00094901AD|nr:chemotaxis response regulator protein-glutamate methylesterase [Maricaulis sp. W15]OLF81619.1 chemotaxis response regulator protein-glutamate methylesterase [Maricaulis sp. W15]
MTELAPKASPAHSIARVLVVDDSAVARGLMTRWVEEDPDLTLVGSAVDGEQGLRKATELKPDLIVLDVEMPKMDGLAALPLLLKAVPGCRVVMASTLTRRGGEVTIRALSMGAADYASKPQAGRLAGAEEFRRDLLSKLKALAPRPIPPVPTQRDVLPSTTPPTPATPTARTTTAPPSAAAPAKKMHAPVAQPPMNRGGTPRHTGRPEIIAIGSSTGGPQALRDVIGAFPADVRSPIVIAQHMPALFTKILAEHLTKAGKLVCKEAEDNERLKPGCVYIAPGDFHMTIRKDAAGYYAVLDQTPPINFCRPAVDPLFQSVAEVTRGAALGIVLTGMGHDGREGARMLRNAGGTILAQDEATSVVWGMPGAVAEAGLADEILSLADMGPGIVRRAKGGL